MPDNQKISKAPNHHRFVPVLMNFAENEDNPPIQCGCLPYEYVGDYINKVMESIAELKENSNLDDFCVFDWDVELCVCPSIRMPKNPIYSKIKITGHTPHYNTSLCGARTIEGCLRKLKNGGKGGCKKCQDKFIVENIGKVFFPNNYKDDNQR